MSIIQLNGNGKIDKSTCTFSITPGKSCPYCKDCFIKCYAMKSYRQYPNVRKSWDSNFELSKSDPALFVEMVNAELSRTKKEFVRIHVAGDFYSAEYVESWIKICKANPEKLFWTYTKADAIPEIRAALEKLESLPNVNIVRSVFNGKINFGTEEYINSLKTEIEATGEKCFICKCGTPDEVKCGKDCHACAEYKYVLFRQH